MAKSDELRRSMGGTMAETVMHRPPPAAMPSVGGQGPHVPLRSEGPTRSKAAFEIALDKITPDPNQPREEFEPAALARLADSIRTKGLLQPISVRRVEGGDRFMIVAGERRWQAARDAGLSTITCIVFDRELPPAELLALQCIENLLRENLTKTEQAKAFRTLLTVNNWTQAELARELGVSQPTISQSLDLLDLPDEVQAQVDSGKLASSVASKIAAEIEDPAEQRALADRFVQEQTSREEAKVIVRQVAESKSAGKTKTAGSKGRGASKGKPRLPTSRVFKTEPGIRITAERSKGLDPAALLAALRETVAKVEAEQGGETAAA
jgi:ParB family transcriptional regulator, chromosome partitioning protein